MEGRSDRGTVSICVSLVGPPPRGVDLSSAPSSPCSILLEPLMTPPACLPLCAAASCGRITGLMASSAIAEKVDESHPTIPEDEPVAALLPSLLPSDLRRECSKCDEAPNRLDHN